MSLATKQHNVTFAECGVKYAFAPAAVAATAPPTQGYRSTATRLFATSFLDESFCLMVAVNRHESVAAPSLSVRRVQCLEQLMCDQWKLNGTIRIVSKRNMPHDLRSGEYWRCINNWHIKSAIVPKLKAWRDFLDYSARIKAVMSVVLNRFNTIVLR